MPFSYYSSVIQPFKKTIARSLVFAGAMPSCTKKRPKRRKRG